MAQVEVVFCGTSVYLSGLAASLRQNRQLRVVEIDTCLDKAAGELKMLRPQAAIGECADSGALRTMAGEFAGLTMIAVDAATDSLTIFTDRRLAVAPVSELERLVMSLPAK